MTRKVEEGLRRLVCWFRGHDWDYIAINERKHANLLHLHTMAGMHAICVRCNYEWDDLWSPFFGDDVYRYGQRRHRLLPRASIHTPTKPRADE
jgi:hypothetical protein